MLLRVWPSQLVGLGSCQAEYQTSGLLEGHPMLFAWLERDFQCPCCIVSLSTMLFKGLINEISFKIGKKDPFADNKCLAASLYEMFFAKGTYLYYRPKHFRVFSLSFCLHYLH